jgi:hypothetical protein
MESRGFVHDADETIRKIFMLAWHDCIESNGIDKDNQTDIDIDTLVQCIAEEASVGFEKSDIDGKTDCYVELDEEYSKNAIRVFSDAYHARKCAECKKNK